MPRVIGPAWRVNLGEVESGADVVIRPICAPPRGYALGGQEVIAGRGPQARHVNRFDG